MGQIEVADMTDFDLNTNNTDTKAIAEMWLLSNGYNPEVDVRVNVGRNYSTIDEDDKVTHRADVDLTIK